MRCRIADRPVPCSWLYFREFDDGRGHPTLPVVADEISVDAETFVASLASSYEDYAQDDKTHGAREDDEDILRLRALGWPPLTGLVERHAHVLETFIARHIGYDVIQCLFPPAAGASPRYLIDSVERARIAAQVITLRGRAIAVPRATATSS
ncbi:hypothetical protein [Myxococcus sp. AS-1-15]|uniref:hypothetical protein n=1 Tax=Myxococcus sp. AS-1-15 TaxID=2874600 RepID=UPI001CBB0BEC|nr:hypothetical protein [Myxococcus sp. AS-1-15]MBZ4394869.1 hypothetical protein [Myxococcus sp. AS-1-15]